MTVSRAAGKLEAALERFGLRASVRGARAVDVGASYDQCLTDFPVAPCSTPDGGADAGAGLPASVPSCTAVIKGPA